MKDLKQKTIRGGVVKVSAQAANFILRIGSLMVLSRLLEPADFGLVGMVMAVIGAFSLFKDFGLSTATVQRMNVTDEQMSALFWINMMVGAVLALLSVALAPVLASFYHEPRLFWITFVLAAGFLFNAAGVQHLALLQRQMRFTALAAIEILSLLVSTAVGIGIAINGYGYWALVVTTVITPLVSTISVWLLTRWIPGISLRQAGVLSMMRFGGAITLNGLVVYVAYNLEKVLLGRFWGADAVGIYGRAYQLINIPTENLNTAIGGVAFSALSRIQDDPDRLKSYFLKGYSLVLAMTLPITIVCAVFAEDLIFVILGPKWKDTATIFRLLTPTILVFALINPLTWLIFSLGMVGRSLKVSLVLAPLVIAGYVIGLPYGPTGVAFAYSVVMTLWVIPHVVWFLHGTMISLRDVGLAVSRPLFSGVVAAALACGTHLLCGSLSPLPRLVIGCAVALGAYMGMLLFVMGQKTVFMDLLQGLRMRSSVEQKTLASA